MREILFRGKRLDNGEWVEGWLYKRLVHLDGCHQNVVIDAIEVYDEKSPLSIAYYVVDPATVGQYTGLKDKNGKRIFEGDILQYGTKKIVVYFNEECFQWQAKEKTYPSITFDPKNGTVWDNIDLGWVAAEIACVGKMTTEVIGNIHDNPNVLEN